MAELNESQLLLLNSLVYVDADYAEGKSVGALVNELLEPGGLDNVDFGGGMSEKDVRDMLQQIAADDQLSALEISGSVDTEIRGVCFVNPKTDDAVIAFRGTGPAYAAWDDNCQGGYLSDTDMQQEALAFAQSCAEEYDNITVTGHSKGGNMAQYVTVLMGDKVDRCVSFDGQGFGDEFLEKYADEIAANSPKIRSVCSYNDYVNILLTPIAGETVYLDNDKFVFPGGHYVYELYKQKNNKLDKNGEYIQARKQDGFIKVLKEGLNYLVGQLDGLDNSLVEFIIYSFVGILMGSICSSEVDILGFNLFDLLKIIKEFLGNLDDYIENYVKQSGGQDSYCQVTVNTDTLREYGTDMAIAARQIDDLSSEIKNLQRKMATNIIKGIAIGLPLQAVMSQLEKECTKLEKLAAFLNFSADQYDTAETSARSSAV